MNNYSRRSQCLSFAVSERIFLFCHIIIYSCRILSGTYYYFHTEANKTYEETVLDLENDAKTMKLPYRYDLPSSPDATLNRH